MFGRDIYAITADGKNLRRITNPPGIDSLAQLPVGKAQFKIENDLFRGEVFWMYIEGAQGYYRWTSAAFSDWTITFDTVDFGDNIQQKAVVGYFGNKGQRYCYYDKAASADLAAGKTVEFPGRHALGATRFTQCYGAYDPVWNYRGDKLLFTGMQVLADEISIDLGPARNVLENYQIVLTDTENLQPGNTGAAQGIYRQTYNHDPQLIRLSPSTDTDVLVIIDDEYADRIYLGNLDEGNTDQLDRMRRIDLGFCNYLSDSPGYEVDRCQIRDIEWFPDGSGFMVSLYFGTGNAFNEQKRHFSRIYSHDLATGRTRLVMSKENDYLGDFSLSPDGRKIAFEWGSRADGPYEIWRYDLDTSRYLKIANDGAVPAWSP